MVGIKDGSKTVVSKSDSGRQIVWAAIRPIVEPSWYDIGFRAELRAEL